MEQKEMDEKMGFTDTQAHLLTKKYSIHAFIELIDKTMLQSIQNIYKLKSDGLDIIQFTRFFMNAIEHHERQSTFLAAGLRDLFENISQGLCKIQFSHLTDFICEKILQENTEVKQLEMKWIPIKSYQQKHNKYLKTPPSIKGGHIQEVSKVGVGKLFTDKGKHENLITQAYYSFQKKKIFILQSLSDWIGIYNEDSKLQRKIRPSNFKVKKDSAVLKIGFSQREERLGAILKDFSISFWDSRDNYQFQKSINTTKYCADLQVNLWYLQYFDKWLTADAYGNIYHWNLQNENPQQHYKCKFKSKINDLCQIPANAIIAVIQEQKLSHGQYTKIQLIGLQRGQIISQIDIKNQKRMLHTLKYSEQYQVLLSAGFEKKISLFEINSQYLDSTLKGEFLGHQSIISCMNIVKKTPMVVSADDKGKIKIWNIKNFKCMQTLDFSDKVVITKLLDMAGQKKIAILGSRITLLYLQSAPLNIKPVFPIKSQPIQNSLIVFTANDMRFYDINSGKILEIDCKYYQEINAEVTCILILQSKEIVTGNQKGQIIFHSQNNEKGKITRIWHSNAIQYLQQDVINKLLISYSDQQGLVVSKLNNLENQQIRSLKGNFTGRQLISICFSSYHSLIAFISLNVVYLCDYQQFKIIFELNIINQDPTSLTILNGLGLIIIGTSIGNIYAFQLNENQRQLTQVFKINTKQSNVTHLTTDLSCFKDKQLELSSCTIISSFQNGQIHILDISSVAKKINFKNSRINHPHYHPYKQLRERFFNQINKKNYEAISINQKSSEYQVKTICLSGHKGGVTSLKMAQFDEHFLISTGMDNRVKIWKDSILLGDTNINLPLPYLWDLRISQKKKDAKKMLQGLQLIQAIFKRFGKDISLGESQVFKFATPIIYNDEDSSKRKQKDKKITLFQDQFSSVDKNYEIIKRTKAFQLGGPSLKRMQMTKKFNNIQRQWKIQKQIQQKYRQELLQSIETKVLKNEEKQAILLIFKDRTNDKKMRQNIEMNPFLKSLQEKLEKSIQRAQFLNQSTNRFVKHSKLTHNKIMTFKHKLINKNVHQSRTILENVHSSSRFMQSTLNFQSLNNSLQKKNNENGFLFQDKSSVYQKNNVNKMLKNIKSKLQKSKKRQNKNWMMDDKCQEGLFMTSCNQFRSPKFRHASIVNELNKQINLHRISQISK